MATGYGPAGIKASIVRLIPEQLPAFDIAVSQRDKKYVRRSSTPQLIHIAGDTIYQRLRNQWLGGIMRVRSLFLVSLILLVSGAGWSQSNRLGDVAGSIKLDPSAIVEKEGYVEDPQAAVKADRDLFGETLRNCSTVANHLGALVEEARNSILYRDDDLPSRLTAASLIWRARFRISISCVSPSRWLKPWPRRERPQVSVPPQASVSVKNWLEEASDSLKRTNW